jgi:hypothetical protein
MKRKVRMGKYLADNFPIQNGLKQGVVISPLLLNFPLEYALRNFQKNQVGLKLNGSHQLLVYADEVTLLGHNVYIIMKTNKLSSTLVRRLV